MTIEPLRKQFNHTTLAQIFTDMLSVVVNAVAS
jgi:hypothetical protein